MSINTYSFEIGQRTYNLETGYFANQAHGSVVVEEGDSQIFSAVVWDKNFDTINDFFPLRVDYQDKYYAGGRFPGGFLKREGRPSESEILKCRIIDRSLRPTFADDFNQEMQIMTIAMSLDPKTDSDVNALLASTIATALTGIPCKHIVAGVKVGYDGKDFILNPTKEQIEKSKLDLFVTASKSGVIMVEAMSSELPEKVVLDAIDFAHENIKKYIDHIEKFVKQCKVETVKLPTVTVETVDLSKHTKDIQKAVSIKSKKERNIELESLLAKIVDGVDDTKIQLYKDTFKSIVKDTVRTMALKDKSRIDGRDLTTVRDIDIRPGMLKRTHGSAVFKRGETTSLTVVTLGSSDKDAQIIDDANGEFKDRFLLHYNFPSFCTGELGFAGSPKRREIGHGNLAKKALKPIIPAPTEFPYSLRLVSEILDSNGSSSMATVCASSLALMDAGVPLKNHVAGIAMGLIKEDKDFAILTDILGDEDHLGDMDFKVAGTRNGITALQMDIKIDGIDRAVMIKALDQAKSGRIHILELMEKALSKPRSDVSEYAPRISNLKVHPNKIKIVIGKGGATIREITEKFGVDIDIDDNGLVKISSTNGSDAEAAKTYITNLTADVEVGQIYEGKITKILEFGAFVQLPVGKDGFLHISQISDEHVYDINDKLKLEDVLKVKVCEIDRQNRIKLTLKDLTSTA